MPDKPNVLLLMTDQQQWRALGSADSSYETPNLDLLAASGTVFTGCHCPYPQCSPSRAAMVTGQPPHQNGIYTLGGWGPGPLDPDSPSVGRAFRAAGYETAWFGKWHLGDDNLGPLGWEVTGGTPSSSNGRDGIKTDGETVRLAAEYLRTRDGDRPFFATVSLNLPHQPFFEDEEFADRYDPDEVPLPESVSDDLTDKPAFIRERAESFGFSEADLRRINYQYRTMISRTDHNIGRALDALEDTGLRDDTVVVFTSDHGEMAGGHRLIAKGAFAYDEILRVPLIVDVPERTSERETVPDLVSLEALPGTLLEAAGISHDFDGGSFLDALDQDAPPDDERVFFEHKYAHWGEHPYRGVRTRDWKYIEYMTGEGEELYHHAEDPHELTNLADESEHDEVRENLRAMVRDWWERTDGDETAWTEPVDP